MKSPIQIKVAAGAAGLLSNTERESLAEEVIKVPIWRDKYVLHRCTDFFDTMAPGSYKTCAKHSY